MTSSDRTAILRVAHVIQNLNFGGMERILHNLARGLPRHGIEVHVIVLEFFGHFAEGLQSAATMHRTERMGWTAFLRPRALVDVLRHINPHVVHSHAGVWFKAARAARLCGAPAIVHTDHGRSVPVPVVDRVLDHLASRSTDAIVAVSEPLAGILARWVVHDRSRIHVIVNGVPTASFTRGATRFEIRQELGIPAGTRVIGSVGRLEPVKNYGLAIRALARLTRSSAPNSAPPCLVLVGDGSERASLEALASASGVGHQVRFLGWRQDAERLYSAFDVFTLTSLSEGTSVSLLEAMSRELCPVVTDVGGNAEVLGLELADLLVPANDEAALAAAWSRCLNSPHLRSQRGAAARARVDTAYSMEAMVTKHAALYRKLVDR